MLVSLSSYKSLWSGIYVTFKNVVMGIISCIALLTVQYAKVTKLTSDAKFEEGDIKASVAAIGFILTSAAKHSVDGQSLDNELQQLGLPKGKSVVRMYSVVLYI